ncbi:porin [Variovorax sp. J22P271]|uniref:porin n=1 Tax=Variovorax davisae TaxID=3053515 RepID=UPI002577E575|nr:porin [Variovorax sp. J22P271]MDM0033786.1 porin [Variovorax sp. J22P271]
MKKTLSAVAGLAVAGVSSAQSTVTVFGVLDASISSYSNRAEDRQFPTRGSATIRRTELTNSAYNSSRLGFRGTEDLGGGLAAGFWLEGAVNNDDGTGRAGGGGMNWQRRSTISLSGAFGEVRLGRDFTPTSYNDGVFDPFGNNGVGASAIGLGNGRRSPGRFQNGYADNRSYVRASNSVSYFLPPNLGGVYGHFMYAFNEATKYKPANPEAKDSDGTALMKPNSQRTGRYVGGRGGYANGPLDVALAYSETAISDDFFAGTTTTVKFWNLGASYDLGAVKLLGEYSSARAATDRVHGHLLPWRDPVAKGWVLGATAPVGPGLIRVAYSTFQFTRLMGATPEPEASQIAIGYVHNLSKRTALYATAARVSNRNGAELSVGGPAFLDSMNGRPLTPTTSTGYDFGIRHAF